MQKKLLARLLVLLVGLNMVDEIDEDDIDDLIARGSFVSICKIDVLKVAKEYLVPKTQEREVVTD